MNTIKIPKADIFDILEDESIVQIEEFATKHDCHATVYVFKRDDKHYKFLVEFSYSDGIQLYDDYVDATEVRPVEKTVIDWVDV